MTPRTLLILLAGALGAGMAQAANVDLVTIPARQSAGSEPKARVIWSIVFGIMPPNVHRQEA